MGNFFEDIFSPGGSESGPVQLPKYTPEQLALLKKLVGRADVGLEGPAPTSPDTFVPTTPSEGNYLDWARSDALKYARGGLPYEVGDEYVNDYMKAYRPVWERARNEALDAIRSEYAGPTYWGTARAEKVGDTYSDWGEKYAMTEADLRLQQDQQRRAAIDKYIGVGTEGLASAGQLERGVEQERVMSNLNKFLRGEEVGGTYDPIYNQNIQLSLALLGLSPYTYGQKEETTGPGIGYSAVTGLFEGMGKGMMVE